jgi:hypothetical protein
MSSDDSAGRWRRVESLQDFVVYLRLLADECAQALADESGDHDTHGRANRSINEFLWGWVAVVRRHLNEADLLQDDGQPGWQGLAFQLHLARTAKPGYNCVLADSGLRWDEVDSALRFQMYAAAQAMGFARETRELQEQPRRGETKWDSGTWAHGRLDGYLSAWAAWLEGAYLKPLPALMVKHGIERRPVEPVTWRSIAFQLDAARTYE